MSRLGPDFRFVPRAGDQVDSGGRPNRSGHVARLAIVASWARNRWG